MTQAFLQPVEVVGKVLHAEHQASVGAEPERVILHDIVHLDELADVWKQHKGFQMYVNLF